MPPLSSYLTRSYLFNLRPDPLGPTGSIVLPALVFGCLAAGVLLHVRVGQLSDPLARATYRRLRRPLLVMGSVGLAYGMAAWQGMPLLSMRLLLLTWVVATAAWVGIVWLRELHRLPQQRVERERRLQREKYLPK